MGQGGPTLRELSNEPGGAPRSHRQPRLPVGGSPWALGPIRPRLGKCSFGRSKCCGRRATVPTARHHGRTGVGWPRSSWGTYIKGGATGSVLPRLRTRPFLGRNRAPKARQPQPRIKNDLDPTTNGRDTWLGHLGILGLGAPSVPQVPPQPWRSTFRPI